MNGVCKKIIAKLWIKSQDGFGGLLCRRIPRCSRIIQRYFHGNVVPNRYREATLIENRRKYPAIFSTGKSQPDVAALSLKRSSTMANATSAEPWRQHGTGLRHWTLMKRGCVTCRVCFQAACNSGCKSLARSCTSQTSCSWTNRRRASTRPPRRGS